MTLLPELPPELILRIISFITREIILDKNNRLPGYNSQGLQLVPDLPSINALSRTNNVFHCTLNQCLYDLCASVEPLGKLAILFAVQHQLENAVEKLVNAGVSLDAVFQAECNHVGLLHIAAGMGLRDMVVKLLEMYGGNMLAMVHTRIDERTALNHAARNGHIEIVRLLAPILLPATSRPTSSRRDYLGLALTGAAGAPPGIEIPEYLISIGADVNYFDNYFQSGTTLCYAVWSDDLALVRFLLVSGADPNLYKHDRYNPLLAAFRTQNTAVVRALVDGGADIHVERIGLVLRCCTNIEILRLFLERGADPNPDEYTGHTLLHNACIQENTEFAKASVKALLEFGVGLTTVEKLDRANKTPVDLAMDSGSVEVVRILQPLVQNPALRARVVKCYSYPRPKSSNQQRLHPLFNATHNQNVEIVQALLAAGADIHIQNRNTLNTLISRIVLERRQFTAFCGEEAEFAMASVETLLRVTTKYRSQCFNASIGKADPGQGIRK
ncbi:ankyrin repeat-containing domain protein [Mycena olivaceomarginata]|nr:ankyrin repeat-containing domain protein [Mycena olivaceomarginata]